MISFRTTFFLFNLFVLFGMGAVPGLAQQVSPDSVVLEVRRPPAEWAEEVLANPDYQYADPVVEGPSLWDVIRKWFADKWEDWFGDSEAGPFFQYLFYVIAGFILMLGIVRLFRLSPEWLFNSKRGSAKGQLTLDEEVFGKTNFLQLAENAVAENAWPQAVHYYYLYVLQELNARGDIIWRPQKTNQQYVNECQKSAVFPAFRRLTYLFDYLGYGDFPIKASDLDEMKKLVVEIVENKQSETKGLTNPVERGGDT